MFIWFDEKIILVCHCSKYTAKQYPQFLSPKNFFDWYSIIVSVEVVVAAVSTEGRENSVFGRSLGKSPSLLDVWSPISECQETLL